MILFFSFTSFPYNWLVSNASLLKGNAIVNTTEISQATISVEIFLILFLAWFLSFTCELLMSFYQSIVVLTALLNLKKNTFCRNVSHNSLAMSLGDIFTNLQGLSVL